MMFMNPFAVVALVLVVLALLCLGISTGVLWTLLSGLVSMIASLIWEVLKWIGVGIGTLLWEILKGIGTGIGSVVRSILSGIGTGAGAIIQAIGLPVLVIGMLAFTCLMIWKAFFR